MTLIQKYFSENRDVVTNWVIQQTLKEMTGVFEQDVLHLLRNGFPKDEIKKIIHGQELQFKNFDFSASYNRANFSFNDLIWLLNREEFTFTEKNLTEEYYGIFRVIQNAGAFENGPHPINHPRLSKYALQFCDLYYPAGVRAHTEEMQEALIRIMSERYGDDHLISVFADFKNPSDKIQKLAIELLDIRSLWNYYSTIEKLKYSVEFKKFSEENQATIISMLTMSAVLDR